MIGDKQDQNVTNGSTAIQAGRDVHYHGLGVGEVRELCSLFLRENFPQLREEAAQAARDNVSRFAILLENRLLEDIGSILIDKLSDPDVQAAINDAVQASARKGDKANTDILTKLISERIANDVNPFKDMVISEAVKVAPMLSGQDISFLTLLHFISSVSIKTNYGLHEIERKSQNVLMAAQSGFGLPDIHIRHLIYTGCITLKTFGHLDTYDFLSQNPYQFLLMDGKTLRENARKYAPSFAKMADEYEEHKLGNFILTTVGQAIALANLSNYIRGIDYGIWIK